MQTTDESNHVVSPELIDTNVVPIDTSIQLPSTDAPDKKELASIKSKAKSVAKIVSLTGTTRKLLTQQKASSIVSKLITQAETGDYRAIEMVAKFIGELDNKQAPLIAIQVNDPSLLQRAREYAQLNYASSSYVDTKVVSTISIAAHPSGSYPRI